jgi:hypothetical protein
VSLRAIIAGSDVLTPSRCAGLATGIVPGSGDGLHASGCGYEHPRACLLPRDEESVRADGNAGVTWLLPEDSAERSRQRTGYKGSDVSPGYSSCYLVGCFRAGESDLICRRMG